jgi:uncharacterized protein
MRKLIVVLAAAALCATASAQAPTEQSLDRLMEVSKAPKLIEQMVPMVMQSMRRGMEEGLKGKTLTEQQQHTMDTIWAKMEQSMREAMAWETLRPMFIQVYQETFTQADIDGLIAFYQSPSGHAFVEKMPTALQRTQGLMMQRIGPLVQKLKQDVNQAIADSKAGQ